MVAEAMCEPKGMDPAYQCQIATADFDYLTCEQQTNSEAPVLHHSLEKSTSHLAVNRLHGSSPS